MIESIHDTQEEAVTAAIAAATTDGPGGVVIAHRLDCKIVGDDEKTCSCIPQTLQLGASA